jgi:hypothetical protein
MKKSIPLTVIAFVLSVSNVALRAEDAGAANPPSWYEIQINGEEFTVEANRVNTLESKKKPGTAYQIAVRVSPTQRVRLDTFQCDYDLPARVQESGKPGNRSVRISHELGYSILLNDLGASFDPKSQKEALKLLVDSVLSTLREEKAAELNATEPHQRMFGDVSAYGATIRYRGGKGFKHVCLVYILTGKAFAASCVTEYLENDTDDVLPLIKKTLDSVRPISARR